MSSRRRRKGSTSGLRYTRSKGDLPYMTDRHNGRAIVPGRQNSANRKRPSQNAHMARRNARPPMSRPAQTEGDHSWSPKYFAWETNLADPYQETFAPPKTPPPTYPEEPVLSPWLTWYHCSSRAPGSPLAGLCTQLAIHHRRLPLGSEFGGS